MRNAEDRTALILRRMGALRRKRERRRDAGLTAVSFMLCVSLAGMFRALTDGGGTGHVPGMYGSALLYSSAGGYVLAGVLAFTAGVVITVLCFRHRHRTEEKEKKS